MNLSHRDAALIYQAAGYSVIPILANGTKKPQLKWEQYQTQAASHYQVDTWFKVSPESGIGIICGQVSGNLEMLELEGRANTGDAHAKILAEMEARDVDDFWNGLLDSGYVAVTPSGGLHLAYRIADHPVPGNTKIARRPANAEEIAENPKDRIKVLSETRGEGGYFVAAPTGGTVHKTGDSWSLLSGEVAGEIWMLSWETRCLIHEAIQAALDEMPTPVAPTAPTAPTRVLDGTEPGTQWAATVTWNELLISYGWSYVENRGQEQLWARPGKDPRDGHSASLYYQGSDNLYVWSSSTELPTEDPISKFAFYTFMEHRGDFSAAAKALAAQGFGTKREVLDISDWFIEEAKAPGAGMGAVLDTPTPAVEGSAQVPAAQVKPKIEQFSEKGVGRFAGELLKDRVRWVSQEKAFRVYGGGVWGRDHQQHVPRLVGKVSDLVDTKVDDIFGKAKEAFDNGDADGKERLDEAKKLKTFAKGIATNRGLKAVAEIMSATSGIGVSADQFDQNLNLLALNNGTFNLETMELRTHNPDDMLTMRIPVTYDADARADRWTRYLEEVIPDPAYRDYLQRAVGMALLGDTSESAFFVLWGETGCGKSQFLEIINAVFGDYGVTAAASAFRESRNGDDSRKSNSLHALRGARYVSTSETGEKSALNAEIVKRVTGGDSLKTHALYESEIEWKPVFTMFMGTNFRPVLDAGDGAIWRRVKPINFPRTFFKDNQPTEDREKNLAGKIIATELAGVFNWVLEGVRAYRAIGLKDPDGMLEAITEYREDSDQVLGFINEAASEGALVLGENEKATTTDLYRMFVGRCRDNGIQYPIGKNKFSTRLESMGYVAVKGSGGVRMRKGIGINKHAFLGAWVGN